jgi:hypothetical protein
VRVRHVTHAEPILGLQEQVMSKAFLSRFLCGLLALGAGQGAASDGQGRRFAAKLRGSEVVAAPVASTARGRADFRFGPDFRSLAFTLKILGGQQMTSAHLHCAPRGQTGPVIADLLGTMADGVSGTIKVKAGLTDANIVPGVDCGSSIGRNIGNLADLAAAFASGDVYVEVYSQANPGGDIRGQLRAAVPASVPEDDFPVAGAAINQAIIAQTTAQLALTQATLAQADAAQGNALAFSSAAQAATQAALAYTQAVVAGRTAAVAVAQAKDRGPAARKAARAAANTVAVALALASRAQIAAQAAQTLAAQTVFQPPGVGGGNGTLPGFDSGIGGPNNGLGNGLITPVPEPPYYF